MGQTLKDVSVTPLLTERLVYIGHRNDHDLINGITAERYLERAHAGFFLDFDVHASLEQFHLGESGTRQFDRMLSSSFSTLASIVANSDCLALPPESMARIAQSSLPVRFIDAPIPMPPLELVMAHNRRRKQDAGMSWLIDAIKRSAERLARNG